jgi:hypothetical protein
MRVRASGNKFDEYTGEWKNQKSAPWSVEEIKIITDMKDNWKKKNMNKTLASKLVGRSAQQVGKWICKHRKNGLRG